MALRLRQRVAAYAVITDGAGRVLLTRDPGDSRGPGRWVLPGGGVEHGEHPEQAVIREVREETGLSATVGELLAVVSDVAIVGRRRRSLHSVRLIYAAGLEPAGANSEAGHQADLPSDRLLGPLAGWFSGSEWPELQLAPFTAQILRSGHG